MAKKKEKAAPKTLPNLSGFVSGLGGKREATFPVDDLAKRASVSAPALAGMKAAFGWNSQTGVASRKRGPVFLARPSCKGAFHRFSHGKTKKNTPWAAP